MAHSIVIHFSVKVHSWSWKQHFDKKRSLLKGPLTSFFRSFQSTSHFLNWTVTQQLNKPGKVHPLRKPLEIDSNWTLSEDFFLSALYFCITKCLNILLQPCWIITILFCTVHLFKIRLVLSLFKYSQKSAVYAGTVYLQVFCFCGTKVVIKCS